MSKIRFFFFACAALVAAAFPAFGAAALPEGYALLPFIKASGNCQVKTGITPVCTDKAELAFEPQYWSVPESVFALLLMWYPP